MNAAYYYDERCIQEVVEDIQDDDYIPFTNNDDEDITFEVVEESDNEIIQEVVPAVQTCSVCMNDVTEQDMMVWIAHCVHQHYCCVRCTSRMNGCPICRKAFPLINTASDAR